MKIIVACSVLSLLLGSNVFADSSLGKAFKSGVDAGVRATRGVQDKIGENVKDQASQIKNFIEIQNEMSLGEKISKVSDDLFCDGESETVEDVGSEFGAHLKDVWNLNVRATQNAPEIDTLLQDLQYTATVSGEESKYNFADVSKYDFEKVLEKYDGTKEFYLNALAKILLVLKGENNQHFWFRTFQLITRLMILDHCAVSEDVVNNYLNPSVQKKILSYLDKVGSRILNFGVQLGSQTAKEMQEEVDQKDALKKRAGVIVLQDAMRDSIDSELDADKLDKIPNDLFSGTASKDAEDVGDDFGANLKEVWQLSVSETENAEAIDNLLGNLEKTATVRDAQDSNYNFSSIDETNFEAVLKEYDGTKEFYLNALAKILSVLKLRNDQHFWYHTFRMIARLLVMDHYGVEVNSNSSENEEAEDE